MIQGSLKVAPILQLIQLQCGSMGESNLTSTLVVRLITELIEGLVVHRCWACSLRLAHALQTSTATILSIMNIVGPTFPMSFSSSECNPIQSMNIPRLTYSSQPAGVGFSMMNNGTLGGPDNELEASRDFDKFLSIFFTEAFPEFSHQPFHLSGESFAGTYLPGFVDYIDRRQQSGVPDVFKTKIDSIILVDAVIDLLGSGSLGQYDHMCKFDKDGNNKVRLGYNQTACRDIEKAVPECQRLNNQCIETYDGNICRAAFSYCADHIEEYILDGPLSRNPQDDRVECDGEMPLCGLGQFQKYLDSPPVKEALGLENWNYTPINYDINTRWLNSNEMFMPSTRELRYILDETPTRVLMINGNNDIIVYVVPKNITCVNSKLTLA